jgi:hypothetical protein
MLIVLERIYRMTKIPVRCMEITGEITIFSRGYNAGSDPLLCDDILRSTIINKAASSSLPVVEFDGNVMYGACKSLHGECIIFGPICDRKIALEDKQNYAQMHKVNTIVFDLPCKTLEQLCATLALTHYVTTGNFVEELEILTQRQNEEGFELVSENQYQTYLNDIVEHETKRHSYNDEINAMKDNCIKNRQT